MTAADPRSGALRAGLGAAAIVLAIAGCATPGGDAAGGTEISHFVEDSTVTGTVLRNVTDCTVDARCALRIQFADTAVDALYGWGDVPSPPCEIPREVSDVAFPLARGDTVEAVVSRCRGRDLYLRRLARGKGRRQP